MLVTLTLVSTQISLFRTDGGRTSQQCVCIYTAVYSQTLTAISIFKYNNVVCIIQVHSMYTSITQPSCRPAAVSVGPSLYTSALRNHSFRGISGIYVSIAVILSQIMQMIQRVRPSRQDGSTGSRLENAATKLSRAL